MPIEPKNFLTTEEVAAKIQEALQTKRPFSLVRIGDGEALTMAQDALLPIAEIEKQSFLRYAGILVPDRLARDELLSLLSKASLVGLPQRWDLPYFSPLVERVLDYHQIHLQNTCDCCINYFLVQTGLLIPLLKNQRLLLIGRRSRELSKVLHDYYHLSVTGHYIIDSYRQIPAILRSCRNQRFDIALISAGIPAVTLSIRIATQFGKVALDLGHIADQLIQEYL
jgi:hypothetical protein